MKRRDTKLESEGAEFLVLGHLLTRGVPCYKAYTQTPGYDLLAHSKDGRRTVTIQVKSRWDRSARGFFLRSIDADFVVAVFLNRSPDDPEEPPEPTYYVLPKRTLKKHWRNDKTPKVYLPDITNLARYESAWERIDRALARGR
ncbi:MAG: hypothetical protein AAF805_05505 [Planctomycetota bacterium]